MTVSELAAHAKVAPTTVLRLIEKFGYSYYNHFKHDVFEAALQNQTATYASLESSFSRRLTDGDALSFVCDGIIENCPKILNKTNQEQFNRAVDAILKARNIYVLGLRSAASISMYFENSIRLFMSNTVLLSLQQEYLFDRIIEMTSNDIVFLVSTWPCTKKTIDFAHLCHKRGIPIILVTNSMMNPISQFSSYTINTNISSKSGEHIFSMIVCQSFIEELGRRVFPKSSQRLSDLDMFFKENNVIIWDEN